MASAARAKAWPEGNYLLEDDYSANRNEWGAMPDGPDAPDEDDGEDDDDVFVGRSGRESELEAAREAARAEHRSRRGVAVTPQRVPASDADDEAETDWLRSQQVSAVVNTYLHDLQQGTDFEVAFDSIEHMSFRGVRERVSQGTASLTLRRLDTSTQGARISLHQNYMGYTAFQFGMRERVSRLAEAIYTRHGQSAPSPRACKLFNSGEEWVLGVRVGPKFYYANVLGEVFREIVVSPQERGYRNDFSIPAIFLDRQARGN